MDFIKSLPFLKGYSVILVVIDHLTKYAHFIHLSHPYIVATVAKSFISQGLKLHGIPSTIVIDKDVFSS